ncbi:MAG: glycosyltransferase [Acetobacter sp.]|nr:glycosyltransferase [Acetobacter sp.]
MVVKFSVIIPVYNVAKYLPECLDSILGQSFADIEVIAVDDGSRDESGLILDDYATRDKRLKVIHQENAGVSVARNVGLMAARGEYISFVDGDDYIAPEMYEELAREVQKAPDADIFVFGVSNVCGADVRVNKGLVEKLAEYAQTVCSKKTFVMELGGSVWTKIFKRSFIEAHNIRFAEGVAVAEDGLFCTECAVYHPVVSVLAKNYYFYRIFRENSTMAAQYELDKELACRDYMIKQSYYQDAVREDKLMMDVKICANLLYRYELLSYEKRLANLPHLETYQKYLQGEYSENELFAEPQYKRLEQYIKMRGKEWISFWQQIFSIKNTRDKRHKEVRVLGMLFVIKRKNA